MNNKYNIALIPSKEGELVIQYAHFLLEIADRYLLGRNSLPHVTLYQLQANEWDVKSIWENVLARLEETSIELTFEKFSCVTFDKKTYWTSLLPDNGEDLTKMHSMIADIIRQPVKVNYDPHMTLISTKNASYENLVEKLSETYKPIKDIFVLALGKSDEVGQLCEVIYSCQKKTNLSFGF